MHDQPSGRKAAIAVIKYSSQSNPEGKAPGGSVLFNPGKGMYGVHGLEVHSRSIYCQVVLEVQACGFS